MPDTRILYRVSGFNAGEAQNCSVLFRYESTS